jgi:hypothetical protein
MQLTLKKGSYQRAPRPGGIIVQFEVKDEGKEPLLLNLAIPTSEICEWLDDLRQELAHRVAEWSRIRQIQLEMTNTVECLQAAVEGGQEPIPF